MTRIKANCDAPASERGSAIVLMLLLPFAAMQSFAMATDGHFVTPECLPGKLENHGRFVTIASWMWWSMAVLEVLTIVGWIAVLIIAGLLRERLVRGRVSGNWRTVRIVLSVIVFAPFVLAVVSSFASLASG